MSFSHPSRFEVYCDIAEPDPSRIIPMLISTQLHNMLRLLYLKRGHRKAARLVYKEEERDEVEWSGMDWLTLPPKTSCYEHSCKNMVDVFLDWTLVVF